MPRPNVSAAINLADYFEKGQLWADWVKAAEDPERARKMLQIYDTLELPPALCGFLQGMKRPVHVLGIAEDWCGDVVQHTPVLARLAEAGPLLKLRLVRRTPELVVRYLTNGAEAIPKFIFLTDKFIEVGNWGPRPEPLKLLMARAKAAGNTAAAYAGIKEFYQADRNQTVLRELQAMIDIALTEAL